MNFEENITCMDRTSEIYAKVDKPYKFLFLNGRMRPQRKWLLLKLSDMGLLSQSLYTNLDNKGAADRELFYITNGVNRMTLDEPLHYLPPEYEVDFYKDQIDKPSNETNVKFHLFNNEWGVRGMARGAIVVVLSDGWDRGDPIVLAEQMERLHRVSFRIVWVNPLKVTPGYAPLARGMAAALPYVDDFVEGHSLDALEQLTKVINHA